MIYVQSLPSVITHRIVWSLRLFFIPPGYKILFYRYTTVYLLNTTQTNNVYETVAATVLSWRGMTVILKKTSK